MYIVKFIDNNYNNILLALGLSSLRPSGSTPNNTPRRDPNGSAMSPTQASKSSTSLLFSSSASNYTKQRILADQLQRAMDSLNQQTVEEDPSEEEDDDNIDNRDDINGGGLLQRESRHRLHIVEDDTAATLSMFDAYSRQLLRERTPDNDSDSTDSLHDNRHDGDHARSFQVEAEDDDVDGQLPSSSSYPYPVGGLSTSVLDSIEAIRRSRLLRGRVGEESPVDSDEDLETTADQSKLCFVLKLSILRLVKEQVHVHVFCSYWQYFS